MRERFDWKHASLDWSRFHSLANLLSLRTDGQAEPSSLSDSTLEEKWDVDDKEGGYSPSVATDFAHLVSDSGNERLKKRFLDCLAGFAANKKGGTAVACSAMEEAEDSVTIWISRNEGFTDAEQPVFDQLGSLLSSLSNKDDSMSHTTISSYLYRLVFPLPPPLTADTSDNSLWEAMIRYQLNRIVHEYIPGLKSSFRDYKADLTKKGVRTLTDDSASNTDLYILWGLLFDNNFEDTRSIEKHSTLLISSYDIRRTKAIETILNSSPSSTSKSKKLWSCICQMARLRVAFQSFKDISLELPSFKKVSIALVSRPDVPANPSQRPLSLGQTFGILGLALNSDTIKAFIGKNAEIVKIERKFRRLQKQKPHIHAEVQMLMYLNTVGSSTSDRFPYFGCSKLSCFMCYQFIKAQGQFSTRGSHGRLFKPWTVPCVDGLLTGQADRTVGALLSTQKTVEEKLKQPIESSFRLERTSVFGGSSVFDGWREPPSQNQLQIQRLKWRTERDRIAEEFRRRKEDLKCLNPISPQTGCEFGLVRSGCGGCSRLTRRRCSYCNRDYFCSESCQAKPSADHLLMCSLRPITTADYLCMSIREDLLPSEEEVLEDFGFNSVSGFEKNYLLGLYKGMFYHDVSPEDIHNWRIEGILADKIKEFYYRIPEGSRGGYFPWFLKNEHILNRSMSKEEALQKLVSTFHDNARPYLATEDRTKPIVDLEPSEKRLSFHLLACLLRQTHPNPLEPNWYDFGFVTCRVEREETELASIYQLLVTKNDGSDFHEFHRRRQGSIPPATFTQFWKAHEAGTLIQLMDSKGLTDLRSGLPFLEDFLARPPAGPRPSVWSLKQFLEVNNPLELRLCLSASVDYGFQSCGTIEEICILMEIYSEVLEIANPLDLHSACVSGDLFSFVDRLVPMKEEWRSLLRKVLL